MSECDEIPFNHDFTWIIEQLSSSNLCAGDELHSPLFTADGVEETTWRLILYPFGYLESLDDNMVCLLEMISDNSNLGLLYCSFTIAIIGSNGKPVISKKNKGIFSDDSSKSWIDFPKKCVFQKRSTCSSHNTLIIQCSMQARDLPAKSAISKNIARTKFGVDRCSFKWTIGNLTDGIECKRFQCPAKSFYEISAQILQGDLVIHITRLEMKILHQMAVCTISLLDTNDLECMSTTARYLFEPDSEVWEFPCFSEEKLKVGTTNYCIKRTISLKCDFSVSNGSVEQEIHNLYVSSINPLPVPSVEAPTTLKDDLLMLFESQKFADLKITTDDEEFLVHRNILIARSPVFSSMIETQTGVIDIKDVEKHILSIFLKFLYTGIVENNEMDYNTAMKLLKVADKYRVISLKDNCCSFLMETLTDENVCEVLEVADNLSHDVLKECAINYIESDAGTILSSDEWKMLVEKNLKLATETFCQISSTMGNACKKMRV